MTRRSLALLLVALLPLSASAQTIYKCIDANGSTTYASSRLDKNCKVISSGPENTLPAPKAKPAGRRNWPSRKPPRAVRATGRRRTATALVSTNATSRRSRRSWET